MKRSIIALIMALAMILTLVACGNSNGGNNNGGNDVKAIQLSLGHTNNTDHHYQVLAESFKKIVEEKSNGQLIINIFPAEQLGSGSEMLESVKSGTQDMVLDPDAYLANYDPLFNVIAMPYAFTSWDHVLTFADSDVAATLNTAIEKQGMTGSEGLFGPPLQAAQTIKDRIHRELGFTVNIGIAPNRLLAKMASDFEKPDKIHVLTQDMVPQKLWPLPVGNLFGVGPKSVKRMHEIGIYTIGDLANADADILRGVFGVRGQVFRDYANGIESEPMTRSEVKDNSYGNSVTTPQDLKRPVEADATMLALCESVAGRLRMDGKTARVIAVQLVDNAFRRSSHQVTLNSPTNSTDVIYHTARELMRQMWPDRPVRLVGVSAEKTGTDNFEQLDFFTDPAKTDKQEKLDRAADALRARFGEGAILRAKLLHPDEKTTAPKALGAAKARDKRKGEL